MTLAHADLGAQWRAARPHLAVTHLDAAGCAVASAATLAATTSYLHREAAYGGYATVEDVMPVIDRARGRLGALLGLGAEDVSWVPNAAFGFAALLDGWPLPRGARVGCTAAEYGSNAMRIATAGRRGDVIPVAVATDDAGLVTDDALERALAAGLDLLVLPHVPSHRGVVQPAGELVARCHAAGVPVLLDVAQSLGQVDVSDVGADAYVGTSRKWLCGPRGVGFVAAPPAVAESLTPPPLLDSHTWDGDLGSAPVPLPGMARIAVGETSVATLVGLANALDELADAGPRRVSERIAALGAAARAALDGCAGWAVSDPSDTPSGSVVLSHDRANPVAVRGRLLDAGVVTSVMDVARAPADLPTPRLRLSFHAYCDASDIECAVAALAAATD